MVSVLLGIALILVGGAAIHFRREAAAGRQQIAGLQAQLQELQARPVVSAMMPQPPPIAASAAPVSGPAAGSSPQPAVEATRNMLSVMQAQESSPEQAAQRMATTRMLMERSFPDLDDALGLSPEEARKLVDLLAQQQERSSAAFRAARESGNPGAAAADAQERQRTEQAELQALLGSKYAQYQDYRDTLPVWQQRRDLRAVLDAEGAPLTDTQSKALMGALQSEQRRITQELRQAASQGAAFSIPNRNSAERNQRLLNAAAPHLTPQQLDGYRGMLDRAAAREQAMLGSLQQAVDRAAEQRAAEAAPR